MPASFKLQTFLTDGENEVSDTEEVLNPHILLATIGQVAPMASGRLSVCHGQKCVECSDGLMECQEQGD